MSSRKTAIFLFVAALLLPIPRTKAEYRAFLLRISEGENEGVEVKSTLDPDQYRGYNQVSPTARISYSETWLCKGRTAQMPICPSPSELEDAADDEADAKTEEALATGLKDEKSPERKPANQ